MAEVTHIWRAEQARALAREVGYAEGLCRHAVLLEEFDCGSYYILTTRGDGGRMHYLDGKEMHHAEVSVRTVG